MSLPHVVRTVARLRETLAGWRAGDARIALVPTMGALHEGHMTLMREARARCDRVAATIFVNPAQFGEGEDYSTYPRREARDIEALRAAGVDLLFAPDVREMYPPGFATCVSVAGVSEGLCGDHRPGHFDGVATVVTKLLLQASPDIAVFGEKDYQQLRVIRRLVRDLDIPVEILGVPTVREADGLAISSRNAYLGPEHRAVAPALHAVLREVAAEVAGGRAPEAACRTGRARLAEAGFDPVEYLEVRDAETLSPASTDAATADLRVLAAAWLGDTRLIDNLPVA